MERWDPTKYRKFVVRVSAVIGDNVGLYISKRSPFGRELYSGTSNYGTEITTIPLDIKFTNRSYFATVTADACDTCTITVVPIKLDEEETYATLSGGTMAT